MTLGCIDAIQIPQVAGAAELNPKASKAFLKNKSNYTKLQNKGQKQLEMKQYRLMQQNLVSSRKSSERQLEEEELSHVDRFENHFSSH